MGLGYEDKGQWVDRDREGVCVWGVDLALPDTVP